MQQRWLAIIGCFIGLMVSTSPAFLNSSAVYLKPMVAELGWSRGQVSAGFAVVSLVAVLLTPFSGLWLDRVGSKRVILVGCVLLPAAMACFSQLTQNYAGFLLVAGLLGIAASVSTPSAFLTVPPQWFERNLGLALSLAAAGLGAGQALLPVMTQYFVQGFGWREAWLAMSAIVLTVGVVNALLLIRENPDYYRARTTAGGSAALDGEPFARVVRSPAFWMMTAAFALVVMVATGTALHLSALMTDRGMTPAQGAVALSAFGLSSIAGRLITGVLLDHLPIAVPAGLFFVGEAVGCVLLASGMEGIAPFIGAGLLGAAQGAEGDIIPFILRRRFGMRAFGRNYGLCFGIYQLGPVIGPILMGLTFDRLHSYTPMLLGFAGVSLVALVLLLAGLRASLPATAATPRALA